MGDGRRQATAAQICGNHEMVHRRTPIYIGDEKLEHDAADRRREVYLCAAAGHEKARSDFGRGQRDRRHVHQRKVSRAMSKVWKLSIFILAFGFFMEADPVSFVRHGYWSPTPEAIVARPPPPLSVP